MDKFDLAIALITDAVLEVSANNVDYCKLKKQVRELVINIYDRLREEHS